MFLQAFGIPLTGENAIDPALFGGEAAIATESDDGSGGGAYAYLNYIFYDKNFEDDAIGGFKRTSTAGANTFEKLTLDFIPEKEGYLFVYVSNEEPVARDVYFDDLKIVHKQSIIAQTDSYYPFGLSHGNMSMVREGRAKNQFLYNGKELVEGFDLGWYDYGARYYAPDLGRWQAMDPLAEKYVAISSYTYVANNPILFVDPDGKVIRIHYQENGQNKHYDYTPGVSPSISNKFVTQVHQAISYVMINDDNNTFQNISSSKEIVNIHHTSALSGSKVNSTTGNLSDDKTKIIDVQITWNPNAAAEAEGGGRNGAVSPSTILLHEADHAKRLIETDTKQEVSQLMSDSNPNGSGYDNNEEKRVIEGTETNYIKKVNSYELLNTSILLNPQNQATRSNHRSGNLYPSKGVNSISPSNGSSVKGQRGGGSLFFENKIKMKQDNTSVNY
jgi:RHS repeat-associated protein